MDIRSFLESPLWQGIQGLLAILTFFLSVDFVRHWVAERARASWVSRTPWFLIFIIVGTAAGISTGLRYQDAPLGVAVALGAVGVGLGVKLIEDRRSAEAASAILEESLETANVKLQELLGNHQHLLYILRRVDTLEQSRRDFQLSDRRMVHRIDEHGNGTLHEELTIMPVGPNYVYFYFLGHTLNGNADQPPITVEAKTLADNINLDVLEVERSDRYAIYAVVLDPPSTAAMPRRIAIDCTRAGIWKPLLANGSDEGFFRLTYPSDSVQLEIWAPPGKAWKTFFPTPSAGSIQMEPSQNPSRIIWKIDNPSLGDYNYKVFI
jgi:hypothetical protein